MKAVIALLCLGAALATEQPANIEDYKIRQIDEISFVPGKEYQYFYDAQILNGIPKTSNRRSGQRIQALIKVQLPREDEFVVQLKHIKFGSINERVPSQSRKILAFDSFSEQQLTRHQKDHLEKPIKAIRQNGLITQVAYDVSEPAWVVNLKRSVLNLLSANLEAKNVVPAKPFCSQGQCNHSPANSPEPKQFFTAYEESVEGSCQTSYSIVSNPVPAGRSDHVLNVTKSINLAECRPLTTGSPDERPEIRYNFHLSDICPTCAPTSKFLNASTTMRMDMAGKRDSFLVERVESISEYLIPDMSIEGASINSKVNQSLILINVEPVSTRLAAPSSSSTKHGKSLIYSLSWDYLKEKFFMEGQDDFLTESPYATDADKVEIVKKLLKQLATSLSPSKPDKTVDMQAPTEFLRLVKVLRMLNEESLEKVHQEAYTSTLSGLETEDAKAVKDIIHTAMGAAGTYPCVKHLIKKIKRDELSEYRAAMAIRQLHNARVVSNKIITELKELVSNTRVSEKPSLKQAAMLALGSLIRSHCVPRDNKFAIRQAPGMRSAEPERCTEQHRRQHVQFFMDYLKASNKWNQKVLALKALSNAALPESVPELMKVIRQQELSPMVRAHAVVAMRPLRNIVPEKLVQALMPVYMDQQVPTQIRVAASYIIISSHPSPAVLRSMVMQLNDNESHQLQKFVFTYLSALANETGKGNPCNEKLAVSARTAIEYAKEETKRSAPYAYSISSVHSFARKFGFDLEFGAQMSNASFVPDHIGAGINTKYLGFFNRDLMAMSISGENLDKALVNLLAKVYPGSEPENRASRYRRSTPSVTELRQKLSEMTRNYENLTPQTSKLLSGLRVLGQEVGFLPVDKDIVQYVKEQFSWSKIEAAAQPLNLNMASLLSEYMYKIPTAMGLPLVVRTQTPVIVSLKGSLGKTSDDSYLWRDADILPTVVSKTELTYEVWSPIVNSGVKVSEQARVTIPVRGSIKKVQQSQPEKPRYEIEVKSPASEGRELLTMMTTPYTFVRQWKPQVSDYIKPELKIISNLRDSRVSKLNKHVDIMGIRFQAVGQMHDINWEKPSDTPVSTLSGPNAIHLIAKRSPYEPSEKIVIRSSYNLKKLIQTPLNSEVHNINTEERDSSSESSEELSSFSSPQHYLTRFTIEAEAKPTNSFRSLDVQYKRSPDSRLQIYDVKAYKDRSQSSPVYCAESQVLYPDYPEKTSDLNKKVNARNVFAWGPNCKVSQRGQKVELLEQSERTRAQREIEQKQIREYQYCKDGKRSPLECSRYLEKASELNKLTFVANYPDMPVWARNVTQKLFKCFLANHAFNADVDKYQKGPEHQIKATIRVDPFDRRRENITIQEPGQKVIMRDIYNGVFTGHSLYNIALREEVPTVTYPLPSKARCLVSDRKIETFDEAVIQAPVTDCWSVLAKDCSQESNFAILMKRMSMGSPAKKIRVLTKNQLIEVSKDAGSFVMRVDGAEKTIPEHKTAEAGRDAYARKVGQSVVKVVLPKEGVTVFFDGEAASIRMSPIHFTRQCGICGHYNRDARDVFRGPASQRQPSIAEFFKQYQIQEGSCQMNPSEPAQYRHGEDSLTSSEESNERPTRSSTPPVRRNRIAHEAGQICVSVQPVKTCPQGYYAKESVQQQVEFGCIADHYDGLEVEAMAQQAEVRDLPSFSDRFTRSVRIASKCAKF